MKSYFGTLLFLACLVPAFTSTIFAQNDAPRPPQPSTNSAHPVAARKTNSPPRLQLPSGVVPIARMTNLSAEMTRPPGTVITNRPSKPVQATGRPFPLTVDQDTKVYNAKAGEESAPFLFLLTNETTSAVTITEARTSCGCTVASLPSQPWILSPGTNGEIKVTVDLRNKRGSITKLVYVYGDFVTKTLTVTANIPENAMGNRDKNMRVAMADRQAVFKGDCASCHVTPTIGKQGQPLFAAACGICHDSEHRAAMVPDLHHLNHATDREFWKTWIASGKPGTLMPAFSKAQGGPLDDSQIDSLADYLAASLPSPVSR
jgi:cytochrome c553